MGLIVLSYLASSLLDLASLPGARFIGPMAAAVLVSIWKWNLELPGPLFTISKGFLGTRIAEAVGPTFLSTLYTWWPILLGGTVWTMAGAAVLGIALTKMGVLPGSTAIWGLSPGGASIMTVMSEEYGADSRQVALMQYTRVVLVSIVAILVARFWVPEVAVNASKASEFLFPPTDSLDLCITLQAVIIALGLANITGFPGGAIVFPLILCSLFRNYLNINISLPPYLVYPAFCLIGWRVGLGFSREELVRVLSKIHILLLAIVLMIVAAGIFAWFMTALGTDPLTAYLATSPGGLDAVTIIASSTNASLPFVASMQTLRLLLVIVFGPKLAAWCSNMAGHPPQEKKNSKNAI